ncbi:MAG: nucleotidyltransferase domain-containing protein [Candidatus Omnitrophica bacterium]|nr:nucleotidyltransferase domain-containing protein [Candidatus Omnitrophota bacterium]
MEIKSLGLKVRRPLHRLGVRLIYLYGSQALERSSPLSDVDIGVVFRNPKRLAQRAALRLELMKCLEPILSPELSKEIDLVFLQTASPVLQFEAINARCPLFVADPVFQADYEAQVMREYLDVRPLVEVHYQAALDRAA